MKLLGWAQNALGKVVKRPRHGGHRLGWRPLLLVVGLTVTNASAAIAQTTPTIGGFTLRAKPVEIRFGVAMPLSEFFELVPIQVPVPTQDFPVSYKATYAGPVFDVDADGWARWKLSGAHTRFLKVAATFQDG